MVLTDYIYAPECNGRIDDSTKDFVLLNANSYIEYDVTLRLVLLSAAFETYFSEFLDSYLKGRAKYYASGARTAQGNKLWGDVMKVRGLSERVQEFSNLANAKIKKVSPDLTQLRDVYLIRNVIAHDGGVCDAFSAGEIKCIKVETGTRISLTPIELVGQLAPACIRIAESLDAKLITRGAI